MRNKKLKNLSKKLLKLSCDVLIIGGGGAGLRAAIEAHDSGAGPEEFERKNFRKWTR